MAFWADSSNVEPYRQFRWRIVITNNEFDTTPLTYLAKKCDLPKAKIGSIQHKYINHFFNFPGRLEWEDINATIVSNKDSSLAFMNILQNAGYEWPEDENMRATISKSKFVNPRSVGSIKIEHLSDLGNPQDTWVLKNAFFTSVQFGALDYSSEEIVDIQCTIKYDMASLTQQ